MTGDSKTEGRRSTKRHFLLLVFLILAVLVFALYANGWKESRYVSAVTVEGNRIISKNTIIALANIPENSKLFELDLFAIERRIMRNAFVKTVAVHRDFPNRVRITVEERTPVALVTLPGRLVYLDLDAWVLPSVRSQEVVDLPVFTRASDQEEFVPGTRTKNRNAVEALRIISIAKEIDEELFRNISEIRLDVGEERVFYTSEYGIPVTIGRENVGMQLVKFDQFWRSIVIRRGADGLQYVDLRFEDQVVVRWNHDVEDTHS